MKWRDYIKYRGMQSILDEVNGDLEAIKIFIRSEGFFAPSTDIYRIFKEFKKVKVKKLSCETYYQKMAYILDELLSKIS